ncbi:MAG: outer membrane lipoprotein carrier protein LolA [Balneolaceae bacterium]
MIFKSIKVFLPVLATVVFSFSLAAQTPNFDTLKSKFEEGLVFESGFEHELTDSYTGEVMHSSGSIWIDEVGYKLESEDQLLVVDGEITRVYDSSRNRVIIDTYIPEDDDFAPSRMLKGVDSTYSISEEQVENGTRVILETEDDFAVFLRVEILLDAQQNPVEITACDISENLIVTTFKNGSFVEMEEGLFNLNYPDDAEIVDLRY